MAAADTFDTAMAYFEQAMEESRLERAESEVRVAKLRTIKALAAAGREQEAEALLAEIRVEQEAML